MASSQVPSAIAQDKPPSASSSELRERARAMHRQGVLAYQAHRYDEAASAFQQAYDLAPAPGLLFNLAQAHRGRGPTACPEALDAYRAYLRAEPNAANQKYVEEQIRDTEPCAAAESQRRAVLARPEPPPQPVPVPAQPAPLRPQARAVPWMPIAVSGLGAAAAAVGIGLTVSAVSTHGQLEDTCKPTCAPAQWEGAETREEVGIGLIAVGSAAIVGGAVWWITAELRRSPQAASGARAAPGHKAAWPPSAVVAW
ncbi:MAG: tetratricopeptide repeat protein [Polyangiaceae bacterium]